MRQSPAWTPRARNLGISAGLRGGNPTGGSKLASEPTLEAVQAIVLRVADRAPVGADSDRGRYFSSDAMVSLLTGAGLRAIERHDVPLVTLSRFLGLTHARAAMHVFAK